MSVISVCVCTTKTDWTKLNTYFTRSWSTSSKAMVCWLFTGMENSVRSNITRIYTVCWLLTYSCIWLWDRAAPLGTKTSVKNHTGISKGHHSMPEWMTHDRSCQSYMFQHNCDKHRPLWRNLCCSGRKSWTWPVILHLQTPCTGVCATGGICLVHSQLVQKCCFSNASVITGPALTSNSSKWSQKATPSLEQISIGEDKKELITDQHLSTNFHAICILFSMFCSCCFFILCH